MGSKITDLNKKQKLNLFNKKIFTLTIWGGVAFWVTTIATSLLPIAVKYRAAYSNWSIYTVWIASLPMGIIIGFCVSYFLLRYFNKIPLKNPILKSGLISFIFLIIAIILIDVPQSFSGTNNSFNSFYYFIVGIIFNLVRFLILGIVIGYLYDSKGYFKFKGDKNEFN